MCHIRFLILADDVFYPIVIKNATFYQDIPNRLPLNTVYITQNMLS